MLIEIHMLQNHAPANMNRDEGGSPKDCMFGGYRRSRISSQSLKRSIRRSPHFTSALQAVDLAVRTRRLPTEVQKRLEARGLSAEMAKIGAEKASGFGNKDGKEQDELSTAQMMLLSPGDIEAVTQVIYEAAIEAATPATFAKVQAKDLQSKAILRGWRPITPDIALFGRMITSDAFRDVEAAVQVAHALSTHKAEQEFDYFTAVDDLSASSDNEEDKGAGMIGDVEFNSACFYKYFSIDVADLVRNLVGPETAQDMSWAIRLARQTVLAFLEAAVFTTPSGKQNSFAAHQLPAVILLEVRPHPTPVSYANAFVKPVYPTGQQDLVEVSAEAFRQHVEELTHKFSLKASSRLWFGTGEVKAPRGTLVCETLDELMGQLGAVLEGVRIDG